MNKNTRIRGEVLLLAVILMVVAFLDLPRIVRADSFSLSANFETVDSDSETEFGDCRGR